MKKIYIKNGDDVGPFYIYECSICGEELPENYPMVERADEMVCGDCAFKHGLITEEEYLDDFVFYIQLPGKRAAVHDGEIYIETHGRKFPWEMNDKEIRDSQEYSDWRAKVFSRDAYTCQKCGQKGGRLNAHHIKPFAKFKDLRFDPDNGITLCEKCHRDVHRQGKSNG